MYIYLRTGREREERPLPLPGRMVVYYGMRYLVVAKLVVAEEEKRLLLRLYGGLAYN